MSAARLGALLHLVDPTLPIGGFNHSNGLETFVQQGVVSTAADLLEYVTEQLKQNWMHNDGAFMSLAYDAVQAGDVARWIELDNLMGACKAPREVREGSYKLGVRLLKIFSRYESSRIMSEIEQAMLSGRARGYYPLVFALVACVSGIAKYEALYALYYNTAVGVVTNGVKLIPLGQMMGQDILYGLREPIEKAVARSMTPDIEWLGSCMVASDIRAMQHERLYTRLYMS
jgi:urease accessory protein